MEVSVSADLVLDWVDVFLVHLDSPFKEFIKLEAQKLLGLFRTGRIDSSAFSLHIRNAFNLLTERLDRSVYTAKGRHAKGDFRDPIPDAEEKAMAAKREAAKDGLRICFTKILHQNWRHDPSSGCDPLLFSSETFEAKYPEFSELAAMERSLLWSYCNFIRVGILLAEAAHMKPLKGKLQTAAVCLSQGCMRNVKGKPWCLSGGNISKLVKHCHLIYHRETGRGKRVQLKGKGPGAAKRLQAAGGDPSALSGGSSQNSKRSHSDSDDGSVSTQGSEGNKLARLSLNSESSPQPDAAPLLLRLPPLSGSSYQAADGNAAAELFVAETDSEDTHRLLSNGDDTVDFDSFELDLDCCSGVADSG